jgi:outer membrane biosynthesis protein TonB
MARIVSAVGEAWEKPDKPVYKWGTKDELEAAPYQWELEIDEVKALLPQPELEKPWPTVSGSVNWTPPAILTPATPPPEPEPQPKAKKVRKRRRKPKPSESEKAKLPETPAPAPTPTQPTGSKRRSRAQEAIRQWVKDKYPDGYDSIALRVIIKRASDDKEFKKRVVPFPRRDVWARALDRRK